MSPPHQFLTIHTQHQRDAYVIRVEGELDLPGCEDLDSALREAERTRAGRIILDLEDLTSIDSSGLEALLAAGRRSASNGNRLQLTRGKGSPAEMFRLTALDMTLPFTDPALCPGIRGTGSTSVARGGWNSASLGPQAPAPENADLPRMGEPFADPGAG
ncbi:MAG: hypothetical protein QOI10_2234 [Solirubrobacterales bacterium]|jgi:anti-sigma B factor antagonist|nr:hypothetical protein [Solirubrobacterales bacterium]